MLGNIAIMTVLLTLEVGEISGARILMAVPIGTRSHNNFYMPLAERLAERNHTVTYVSGYELSTNHRNIQVIVVPDVQIFNNMPSLFTTDSHTAFRSIQKDIETGCIKALAYEGVQNLKDESFDLVILYGGITDCFLTFVHRLQVPFIYVNPNKIVGVFAQIAGSPAFPSLDASYMLDLDYPLTFKGRMISTLYDLLGLYYTDWIVTPSQDAECRARQLCPKDMPSLMELRLNGSLFITNSVRSLENPTLPYTPTVVHAGGIQCRPAKPLPEDLEKWMTGGGKSGVILFSLGSFIKSSSMPEQYREVLLKVFGSLQQRILWKWDEETMEGLPPNVRLSKWLPQQDILGHQQVRLFITHGGLFSTQEAIYHSVPVLGMPVSLDQIHNMLRVQRDGWGHVLRWEDLTYDTLRGTILQIIDNQRMLEEVKHRSRLMKDHPMPPGDWAAYWVEYVLRHQGAAHLRSPAAHMPWYQLYNADVWAMLAAAAVLLTILVSWLSCKIFKAVARCCFASQKKTKKE